MQTVFVVIAHEKGEQSVIIAVADTFDGAEFQAKAKMYRLADNMLEWQYLDTLSTQGTRATWRHEGGSMRMEIVPQWVTP